MKPTIQTLLDILEDRHQEAHGIPEADIQAKEQSFGFPLLSCAAGVL